MAIHVKQLTSLIECNILCHIYLASYNTVAQKSTFSSFLLMLPSWLPLYKWCKYRMSNRKQCHSHTTGNNKRYIKHFQVTTMLPVINTRFKTFRALGATTTSVRITGGRPVSQHSFTVNW